VNIQTKQTIYKLERLNDERYYSLRKNCILIDEDYLHLLSLSRDKDVIFSSFSKMFIALKELFGDSGKYYDDWKGSFSFPFIISFKKSEEEFRYIMNIYNIRSSIEFNIAKLIQADDERFERDVIHEPFEEFPRRKSTILLITWSDFLQDILNPLASVMMNSSFIPCKQI